MDRHPQARDRAHQRAQGREREEKVGRALAQPRSGRRGGCGAITGKSDLVEGYWQRTGMLATARRGVKDGQARGATLDTPGARGLASLQCPQRY